MDLDRDFVWVSKRLVEHEGCVLKPYTCPAGKLTIGVGRNIEDNPLTEQEKRALGDYMHGITKNGAMLLLRNDVAKCLKELKLKLSELDKTTRAKRGLLLMKEIKKSKKLILEIEKDLEFLYSFEVIESWSWYDEVNELKSMLTEENKKLSGFEKEKKLVFMK